MGNLIHTAYPCSHAHVIANPDVWVEGEALRQLARVAADPDCAAAVGMPDLHPGPGVPIGAVFGFKTAVRPQLIGSDAGCGVLVVALDKVKLPKSLERRVDAAFDGPPINEGAAELFAAAWQRGPRALTGDVVPVIAALAAMLDDSGPPVAVAPPVADLGATLGTIGGGNHFVELGRVTDIRDGAEAERLGLRANRYVVLCHSGSRGAGKLLADRWGDARLERDSATYLAELAGAIHLARVNRLLLAGRLLAAMGVNRDGKLAGAFDLVHNTVVREPVGDSELWIHRKGCAPAHDGEATVVLGSRGAPSWVMCGTGSPIGLSSVAHGAGRKMQRSEARDKLRGRYRRSQLRKSKLGSIVICDDTRLLYEEHPDAYKPIEPVVASLEAAGLARRIAAIEPILTVKR